MSHKVGKRKLAIKTGDPLQYLTDKGTREFQVAKSEPWKLSGKGFSVWVILISGHRGCVALDRCLPLKMIPA